MFGGLFNHKKTQSDDDWGQPIKTSEGKKDTPNNALQPEQAVKQEEKSTEVSEERQPEEQLHPSPDENSTQETPTEEIQQEEDTGDEITLSKQAQPQKIEETKQVHTDNTSDVPEYSSSTIDHKKIPDEISSFSDSESETISNDLDTKQEDIPTLPPLKDTEIVIPVAERVHFLDDFSIDITRQAEEKKLRTIIERDQEIEKIIHILLKNKKNCPMIIGEQGVGKTALIHGLAQKMHARNVPDELLDGYIVEINCIELAGLLDKKEIELNLESLLQKIQQFKQKVILLLDDLSRVPDGIRTILTLLKTYLAKNNVQLIICVTPIEHQRYFSEDSFFQDICETVSIGELSEEISVKILKNLAPDFESFHHVVFDDDAISRAVLLSARYVGEAFLPEKALDIIDDAATLVKVALTKKERADNRVTKKDVEQVIADRTGIALTTLIQDETEVLLKLEEYIHQHFIDQQKAVSLVADVIRKGRSPLADKQKPLGSLLLVGPPGTGKTKLAQVAATILFGSENAVIQFDIAQENYKQKLLEAVYKKPYSVVFLKNIETAHQQTVLTLSEVLAFGKVTDHKGNTVSFENSLIICTTDKEEQQTESQTQSRDDYQKLPKTLKPELINAFDEVIMFESLSQKSLQDIASLQLQALNERLMKENISLAVSDKVLERIAKEAYNPQYGAHLLGKVIESLLENPVATLLLSKTFVADDTISVTVDEQTGKFVFAKTMRNLAELPDSPKTDTQELSTKDTNNNAIDEDTHGETTPSEHAQSQNIDEAKQTQTDNTIDAQEHGTHTPAKTDNTPHPLSFDTYHQQVKHAYSDLLSSLKK